MTKARILVVTPCPHPPLAPELPGILEGLGYQVELACHGPEALVRVATARPDMIVAEACDLRREAVSFAQIVRDRPAFADLPMIAVVGEISLRDHAALLAAGFDRVVPVATAVQSVPRAAADLFGSPNRIPSLLEAFTRATATMVVPQPRMVASYPEH